MQIQTERAYLMLWYSIDDFRDFVFTAGCSWGQSTSSLSNTTSKRETWSIRLSYVDVLVMVAWMRWQAGLISLPNARNKKENMIPPLHSLLHLSLLADLRELLLVVLPHLALFGSAPRVVFDALHFLLPGLHQLVITLAKLLFLKKKKKEHLKFIKDVNTFREINCVDFYFAFTLSMNRNKLNATLLLWVQSLTYSTLLMEK